MKTENGEYRKRVHTIAEEIPGLQSREYEDSRDAAYLSKLKLSKGFDKFMKLYFEYGIERINTIAYTGSNVRVTAENMPYLYECLVEGCRILNIERIPPLYVMQGGVNAFTIGASDPIIVINDSCLRRLNHEELMFIIGHELGHIKSEHCLYHSLGASIPILGGVAGAMTLGFGDLITQGLMVAYYDWLRKSEYTADRAGLLTCQDMNSAVMAMAKLAGLPKEYFDTYKPEYFLEQAREFEDMDASVYNRIMKMVAGRGATHPWTVQRAQQMNLWVQSGEYQRVLNRTSKWLVEEEARLTTKLEEAQTKEAELCQQLVVAQEESNRLNSEAEQAKAILPTIAPQQKAIAQRNANLIISAAKNATAKAKSLEDAYNKTVKLVEETQEALTVISATINHDALEDIPLLTATQETKNMNVSAVDAAIASQHALAQQVAATQAAAATVSQAQPPVYAQAPVAGAPQAQAPVYAQAPAVQAPVYSQAVEPPQVQQPYNNQGQ
ncbi:MAG: M48 family metalloprotease [Lachnospiraceae bacterium]|nr:M48 family metalloprotease [Lachnospiraceae bacterium]